MFRMIFFYAINLFGQFTKNGVILVFNYMYFKLIFTVMEMTNSFQRVQEDSKEVIT